MTIGQYFDALDLSQYQYLQELNIKSIVRGQITLPPSVHTLDIHNITHKRLLPLDLTHVKKMKLCVNLMRDSDEKQLQCLSHIDTTLELEMDTWRSNIPKFLIPKIVGLHIIECIHFEPLMKLKNLCKLRFANGMSKITIRCEKSQFAPWPKLLAIKMNDVKIAKAIMLLIHSWEKPPNHHPRSYRHGRIPGIRNAHFVVSTPDKAYYEQLKMLGLDSFEIVRS